MNHAACAEPDLWTLAAMKPAAAPPSPLAGTGIPLRWCQRQDADAMTAALEAGHRRPCCVGATGYGKGAVIAETVGRLRKAGKVLCLVDRAHLVNQLADEIERHLPAVECGRVADGTCFGIGRGVVVATVQAMYTPDRTGRPLYAYPQFEGVRAVIADEAHKFFAPCFRSVLEYFAEDRGAVVPLFTATPVASNGSPWLSFVDWTPTAEGPCMRTVPWCVRNGYLVPPVQAFVRVELDLAALYKRIGEGTGRGPDGHDDVAEAADEVSSVLLNLLRDKGERAAASFASGVADVIGSRQSIIFAPPTPEGGTPAGPAKLLASWLAATGRLSCDAVWGGRADKGDALDRFRRRAVPQAVANVNLLCEGFDCPTVSAVFVCRLLKKWRIVQQMVGRALRPHPADVAAVNALDDPEQADGRRAVIAAGAKPDALVADLVGLDDQVLQASAVDVLYAAEDAAIRREIAETVARRPPAFRERDGDGEPAQTPDEVLAAAKARVAQRQQEQLAEMARRRGMAGDLPADVCVTYGSGGGPALPSVPVAKSQATDGEKAFFVAVATQYDVDRALDIAARTPRNVLRGMTFSMKSKLESSGGRPDWQRARRAFPEWAAAKANNRR